MLTDIQQKVPTAVKLDSRGKLEMTAEKYDLKVFVNMSGEAVVPN